MENEFRRGYELPLTRKKWEFWPMVALVPVMILYFEWRGKDAGFTAGPTWIMRSMYLLLVVLLASEFVNYFGRLHLVPEGIAITLFGKTLRQFPRENIRFLGGVCYRRKSREYKWICVCDRSMEELAEEQERKTPKMFRDARTLAGWTEDMAGKYLIRYVASLRCQFGIPRKDILLVEWSPERLELLMEMYPGVPWCDLSDKKKLDAERIR